VLSRVAENVYWLARYVERTENTARLINVTAHVLMDLPVKVRFGWDTLLTITGSGPGVKGRGEAAVIRFLTADYDNPGSLISSLYRAREGARTVRDILPQEAWEQINAVYLEAGRNLARTPDPRARYNHLNAIVRGCQELGGIVEGTMSRDWAFEFLRAGRHLERADMTTRIIDVRAASRLPETVGDLTPFENVLWMGVLRTLSAYQMYRRHTHGMVRRPDVLTFLFTDPLFPRSFLHCVSRVEESLHGLPGADGPLRTARAVGKLATEVAPGDLKREELHQFIDDLQIGLAALNDRIKDTYFPAAHAAGQ